jgi:hypothetical protein
MDVKRLEDKGLFFLFYSVLGNRDERSKRSVGKPWRKAKI